MPSNLSVAVMAHVSRERHIPYLLSRLGDVPVFMDDGTLNVWGNAQRAWSAFDPAKEFHLVVEDDSLICADFYAHLERLLARFGDRVFYSLFFRRRTGSPFFEKFTRHAEEGLSQGFFVWGFMHCAHANVYPTRIIPSMLAAGRAVPGRIKDADRRYDGFIRASGMPVVYALPSLVDQRAEEPSLIGHGHNRDHQAWKFRGE